MASIPDEIVERVKSDANIVDVVGDYVRLRKKREELGRTLSVS